MNRNKTSLLTVLLCATGFVANAQWSLTGNNGTNATSNFVGTKDNQSVVFRSNNLERMRISNNGFIGIGTNKPQALFHLPSKGNVTLTKTDNFLLGDTTAQNLAFDYNKIQARNKRLANTLQLNPKGGAVAIGNINGTANSGLYVDTNGTVGAGGQYIQPGYTLTINQGYDKNGIYLYNPVGSSSEKYLLYGENNSSRATGVFIQNTAVDNGNVVIGARTFGTGTAIYGINANSSSYGSGVVGSNEGFGYGVYGYSNSGAALFGDSYNNYGLYAKTATATYSAYFNRSIYVNGSVFTSSDQKLKQNIEEFTSATAIINQLHPRKYQYRQDGDFKLMKLPEGVHYGLIAQEVEKVLPNLVKDTKFDPALEATPNKADKNGNTLQQQNTHGTAIQFKAVNYTELIPILIKGMQEQQQKIEELTAQVSELKEARADENTMPTASHNSLNDLGYLLQNTPNPFNETTTIHYYLPMSVNKAVINITNAAGILVKSFDLQVNGKGSIVLQGSQLMSGTYYYSLIINGKTTDTKKMVLLK